MLKKLGRKDIMMTPENLVFLIEAALQIGKDFWASEDIAIFISVAERRLRYVVNPFAAGAPLLVRQWHPTDYHTPRFFKEPEGVRGWPVSISGSIMNAGRGE